MVARDRIAIANHLQVFKERGVIQYDRVFSIPATQRIGGLVAARGQQKVAEIIGAALSTAFNSMNLKRPMSADQIAELADEIIYEAQDDRLAMEDVLLFLQQLVRGKAGPIYDRMDAVMFFQYFDNYREERHFALLRIREEQEANYKAAGDQSRSSEFSDHNQYREALKQYLSTPHVTEQGPNQQNSDPGA